MLGLNNFISTIVINGIDGKPNTIYNSIERTKTVRIAAELTQRTDINGNQHKRYNIYKELFSPEEIETIQQLYGALGLNYNEYTAYKNWIKKEIKETVNNKEEIIFIKNTLLNINRNYIQSEIYKYKILPDRFNK